MVLQRYDFVSRRIDVHEVMRTEIDSVLVEVHFFSKFCIFHQVQSLGKFELLSFQEEAQL